ncbi:MAG TPA: NTP transferase domain-containing protein, partial [Gemmatimonadaceae bacterium]|nr:NTP transferase domain-containing protein [Gemmatimonadaceae bacterium]
MSTLAVIPARLGATRLPRKPLRLLGGTPLVIRVWQRALALSLAERVLIATDHPDVVAVAREAGAECVMTAASHPSGTDRVAEVAGMREYSAYEIIVNIQGDEPFIPMEAVRGAASMVSSGRFVLGTASAPAPRSA